MSVEMKCTHADVNNFLDRKNLRLSHAESEKLHDFLKEPNRHSNKLLGWIYSRFKKLFQGKKLIEGMQDALSIEKPWEEQFTYSAFAADYHIFSRLSNYYGNQYRGSFVVIYFLGALAVLSALVPVGFSFESIYGRDAHHYAVWFTITELLLILLILLIHKRGANPHHHHDRHEGSSWLNQRWHERWIDYRILAERFRYMEILYPIGIDPLKEGVAADKELQYWTNAYFATRLSQVSPERTMDLTAYKARLIKVIEEQHSYHHKNAHRAEHIYHRLHTIATWLFYATLVACLLHFVWHSAILTLMAGFFPALAAALHGILATGEYSKTAEVSSEMHKRLSDLIRRLKITESEGDIRQIAMDFHNMAIGETDSWRSIFKDKNVPLA